MLLGILHAYVYVCVWLCVCVCVCVWLCVVVLAHGMLDCVGARRFGIVLVWAGTKRIRAARLMGTSDALLATVCVQQRLLGWWLGGASQRASPHQHLV